MLMHTGVVRTTDETLTSVAMATPHMFTIIFTCQQGTS